VAQLKRLWAPWRAEYIYCAEGKPSSDRRHCLFCRLAGERRDRQNLILRRGLTGFVVMNRFPYNNGHLMIAPYRHVATFEKLAPAEGSEMLTLLNRTLVALRRAFRPAGFNVGANLGRAAGAGVAGHVHLHVVPRWQGDSNFMPLLAETKVVSEHLQTTYGRLMAALCAGQRAKSKRQSAK
jgi:ATP adenylyltransferase